jgi:acyl carrier protein
MHGDRPIRSQVRSVLAQTLDLDEADLPDDVSQETVPRWSSLVHLVLVLNLEERFGVSFSMEEMLTMTSAARIVDVLHERL